MKNLNNGIMLKKVKSLLLTVIVGLLFGSQLALADGEFYVIAGGAKVVGTPINSLPFTITDRGFYYLTKNLTTATNGIIVCSHDVTIDLMGFTINGPSPLSDYSGISVSTSSDGVFNVTIRNGTIRNFSKGINAPRTTQSMQLSTISNITIRECPNGILLNTGIVDNCKVYASPKTGFGIQIWNGIISKCYVSGANVGIDTVKGANIQENVAFYNGTGIQSKYTDPGQEGISILNNNYSSDNTTTNYNVFSLSVKGLNLNF
jgi:hypothetical protein